ncbi:ribonuclease P protein component [Enterobacteriaceae endosymbiont of Neohaemonia nigricornis]|uniref:ribonuclease P protein component n=1 Tax=Enterobacteriaceae endosymbiont of Neohaemonia nigricornis TaxID=2675792 RepID=UPI001ABFFA8B|nr:ribonuclease P protein component [Enterobacteriaceae endosymbiont of Neohaemonia nigricornis]
MSQFKLSKKKRLCTWSQYNTVFKQSHKISNKYYILLSCSNKLQYSRIGIIISKKYILHAYIRNKHKRIIREHFRLNQNILKIMDYVIIINNKIKNIHIKELNIYLEKLWQIYKLT